MPFCTKCGEEIPGDAEFCPNCGVRGVRATKSALTKSASIKHKIVDTKLKWERGLKKGEVIFWKAMCIISIVVGSISLGMVVFLSMLPRESLPVTPLQLAGATSFFIVLGIIFLASAPFEYLHAKHLAEKLEKTETRRKKV